MLERTEEANNAYLKETIFQQDSMKAVEVNGFFDETGALTLEKLPKLTNQRVKVILLIPESEEIDEGSWLTGIATNPAFDFLEDPAEDLYSITDGQPVNHEA